MSDSAFVVERRLALTGADSSGSTGIADILGSLDGVIETRRVGPEKWAVRYDRRHVGLRELENALNQRGIRLSGGRLRRLAWAWVAYLDSNAKGNTNTSAAPCCSDPREIYASRRKQ